MRGSFFLLLGNVFLLAEDSLFRGSEISKSRGRKDGGNRDRRERGERFFVRQEMFVRQRVTKIKRLIKSIYTVLQLCFQQYYQYTEESFFTC